MLFLQIYIPAVGDSSTGYAKTAPSGLLSLLEETDKFWTQAKTKCRLWSREAPITPTRC